jgi:tryptophan-rich sensory protein
MTADEPWVGTPGQGLHAARIPVLDVALLDTALTLSGVFVAGANAPRGSTGLRPGQPHGSGRTVSLTTARSLRLPLIPVALYLFILSLPPSPPGPDCRRCICWRAWTRAPSGAGILVRAATAPPAGVPPGAMSLAVMLLVGGSALAASALVAPAVRSPWYAQRVEVCLHPAPPRWLFAPVWTVLYLALAAGLLRVPPSSPDAALHGAFLALSVAWCLLFFRLRRFTAALCVCLLLSALAAALCPGNGPFLGLLRLFPACTAAPAARRRAPPWSPCSGGASPPAR